MDDLDDRRVAQDRGDRGEVGDRQRVDEVDRVGARYLHQAQDVRVHRRLDVQREQGLSLEAVAHGQEISAGADPADAARRLADRGRWFGRGHGGRQGLGCCCFGRRGAGEVEGRLGAWPVSQRAAPPTSSR